jgi:queuine tRNA-ribosyltransferase
MSHSALEMTCVITPTLAVSPEKAMDVQARLGSDIVMVLDECLEFPCTFERASASLERTLRWAARSKAAYT